MGCLKVSKAAGKNAIVVAVYSLKGGVGKTTLAVNLAAEAAKQRNEPILLWDLDPQAAASYILGRDDGSNDFGNASAQSVFEKDVAPKKLVLHTAMSHLDVLPADASLRGLDGFFSALGKKRRLAKLIEELSKNYRRIVLDCPPGLTETSEQMMRAADIIIVPVIPSPLSRRALDEVVAHLKLHHKGHAPLLPVYSMVDRRRAMHKAALLAEPDWPRIPMASAVEQMATRRAPVSHFASKTIASESFAALARAIDRKLAKLDYKGLDQ
jgi:cellulose biosynthesis protein BcsQ